MKKQRNSNSGTSLIFGILSILFPFIGIIFGAIGVVFSRKAKREIEITNENGRGLATAGLIFSVFGMIIQAFILLAYIMYVSFANVG